MPANVHTHQLKLFDRTVTVRIEEKPSQIVVAFAASKIIPWASLEDSLKFQKWIFSLIQKYDSDKRPTNLVNFHTGSNLFIVGDANESTVFIPI